MKRILCIWFPNWPIQRHLAAKPERNRPEPSSRAVVLYDQHPRRGERVTACSPAAAVLGIRPGIPLAEVAALTRSGPKTFLWEGEVPAEPLLAEISARRPHPPEFETDYKSRAGSPLEKEVGSSFQQEGGLQLHRHDWQADRKALEQLACWCEQFSPLVGLEERQDPECLFLDVTGLAALLGDEEKLGGKVIEAFGQHGYTLRVAIADTLAAAWAVAHFAVSNETGPCRPPSIVEPGQCEAAVGPLPIEALRLSKETSELLHRLGVFRIAQLLRLPRCDLPSRFAPELIERLDQLAGHFEEFIVPHRPLPKLEAIRSLEHPTAHRATIDGIFSQLIGRLTGQLAQRNEGAVQLQCRLDCSGGETVSMRVGLFQPNASAQHLLELIGMQLELLALPGAVHRVTVGITICAKLLQRQHALLADSTGQRPQQLALLTDRLSSRLGGERIVQGRLRAGAQPERAFRYVRLTGQRPSTKRIAPRESRQSPIGPLQRPLRMLYPPQPLQVVCVAPDGPPVFFDALDRRQRISRHWGPERIETGWWHGRSVRRDYYRIETETGSRFWVFRRLQDGKWFLHGAFE